MASRYRCLSAIGMLGYGIHEDSLACGLEAAPDMLGCDAGSTDDGPQKLGGGIADVSRDTTARDLRLLIRAGTEKGIPIVIGSAGGAGADTHLEWTWDIVREVAENEGVGLRVALIHAEVSIDALKESVTAGKVASLGPVPRLDDETLDRTIRVVGQMGAEPIISALDQGANLVLAGRACDAAIFAAPAIRHGSDPGLAWHMGELLECGAMAAQPGSASDCLMGSVEDGRFVIEPVSPERSCTPLTVAAHSLYERSHPSRSVGPGHVLDVSECRFEAVDGRRVMVSGSRFIEERPVRVKLEGAGRVGYRTMVIGGIRDPVALRRLDETLEAVETKTWNFFARNAAQSYSLRFIIYGRDGVMGAAEPTPEITGHEVGLLLDVVADTQEIADTICAYARASLQHYYYEGIRATGANIAFPVAPSDIPCGPVYEFTVHHLVEVGDPLEMFPVEMRTIGQPPSDNRRRTTSVG